ncbi:MAG: cyclic nucleotide-binding domain-containing protein [Treponema sp.]|jgi:CRP-like cAMP-binding protein|nr:cyclic nucleotide-binding domain-containing protein [Treponema sp.]
MPKLLSYQSGSVIYFQGDIADKIYIVQQGSVRVTSQNIETGSDEHDTLQPGEFFGVKSALGGYNREENAVTVQDSVIVIMSVSEFEQFATANTRIVMKMLKVFSNQLRRVHRQVMSLMVKEGQPDPEAGLFRVGEYYLRNKRYVEARYVFSRYLTYYPASANASRATKGFEIAETALSEGNVQVSALPSSGTGFIVGAEGSLGLGAVDFSSDAEGSQAARGKASPSSAIADAAVTAPSASKQKDVAEAYYNALNFISQNEYPQAYTALQEIIKSGADQEYVVKSSFDLGHCLFLMGQFNACIQHLSQVISTYPKHPLLGTGLFFMGQSYEKIGYRDQAAAFYKKVLSIIADEEDEVYSKAKRALEDMVA